MEKIEIDKGLIKLAEKIIDQNEKILRMNGMVLEMISKPKLSIEGRDDFLEKIRHMDEETRKEEA